MCWPGVCARCCGGQNLRRNAWCCCGRRLCALKEAAERCGVTFDYYGVRVTFEYVQENTAYYAAYLPAGQITDEAAVAALLGEMRPVCGEEGLRAMMAFFAAPQAAEANAMRTFAPCGH